MALGLSTAGVLAGNAQPPQARRLKKEQPAGEGARGLRKEKAAGFGARGEGQYREETPDRAGAASRNAATIRT
jgi:hypothetical protein